jgi:DNA-directed RNA polymerase I subunit RPA2
LFCFLQSSKCHLAKLTGPELIRRREEEREQGGYFVLNGIERLVRLLIMPRRNIVLGIQRSSYAKRGHNYSSLATTCRSVRPDQSAITVTVHYLTDGNCTVRFSVRKQEFLLPAVLVFKALVDTTGTFVFVTSPMQSKQSRVLMFFFLSEMFYRSRDLQQTCRQQHSKHFSDRSC